MDGPKFNLINVSNTLRPNNQWNDYRQDSAIGYITKPNNEMPCLISIKTISSNTVQANSEMIP